MSRAHTADIAVYFYMRSGDVQILHLMSSSSVYYFCCAKDKILVITPVPTVTDQMRTYLREKIKFRY